MTNSLTTPPLRQRALIALDAVIGLLVVIGIAQMWILAATLDSYLGRHGENAIPGAIASGLLFAAAAGLYVAIRRVDARAHR